MDYFDDILNVYAYLFSKSKQTADTSRKLAQKADELDTAFADLNTQADTLLSDADALLAHAYALAEDFGLDTASLSGGTEAGEPDFPKPVSEAVYTDIRIPIPVNFDYRSEFQRLTEEAHNAGFTNVHPEELLTQEEMAQAEAFSDALDAEFCIATQLQPKDMVILSIAVAARVLFYFLSQKIQMIRRQHQEQEKAQQQRLPTAQVFAPNPNTFPEQISASPQIQTGGVPTAFPINAAQGVDINGMLGNLNNHSSAVKTGQNLVSAVSQQFGNPSRILDHITILDQNTPFDVQETDLFKKEDIVAYHKFLGWIVGTLNILTDTITTYRMKSYSITRPMLEMEKPYVNQEISTLLGIIKPVMQSAGYYKDSIAAAAVQEALTQGFGKASPQEVRTLFGRAIELETRTTSFAEETKGILGNFNAEWASCIGGIASSTLINTIVSALHAILYEKEDGSLDTYSIRTNKIILYSGAMATFINSLPAIASQNVANLDFAGILTTCISLFQSNKFWIEAKTAFLVSTYKQSLEQKLATLDQYFLYQ